MQYSENITIVSKILVPHIVLALSIVRKVSSAQNQITKRRSCDLNANVNTKIRRKASSENDLKICFH